MVKIKNFQHTKKSKISCVPETQSVSKDAKNLRFLSMKKYILSIMLLVVLVLSGCEEQNQVIGGDKDEHGCLPAAGYTWCESKQKCLREWEEPCEVQEMSQELCENANGKWSECSSKCQLMNVGRDDVACLAVCEQLCECGGIAGFGCPAGYNCKMSEGIADALGYCTKQEVPQPVYEGLTYEQARIIAAGSECTEKATLTDNYFHNEDTKTWWIDLEMMPEFENKLCNPACVVFEETGAVEINWRCTGALPPE